MRPDVCLRLRNRADRDHVGVSLLIDELSSDALLQGEGGTAPTSIGAGEADVADLGANAKKYLRSELR